MRGSILDLIPLMIIMGVFGLMLIVASMLNTAFSTGENPIITGVYEEGVTNSLAVFDANAILLLVGIMIAVVLSALAIMTHPVFIIPAIIAIIIIVSISPMLSNTFMYIASDPAFVAESNKYPTTISIIDGLPYAVGIAAFLIFIALYAKGGGGSER